MAIKNGIHASTLQVSPAELAEMIKTKIESVPTFGKQGKQLEQAAAIYAKHIRKNLYKILAEKAVAALINKYADDDDVWFDATTGNKSYNKDAPFASGQFGFFPEINLFGTQPNRDPDADIKMGGDDEGEALAQGIMEGATELKQTLGLTVVHIGTISAVHALEPAQVLEYKMLSKMQNLLYINATENKAKTVMNKAKKRTYAEVRFEEAYLFTNLKIEQVRKYIEKYFSSAGQDVMDII